MIYINIHKFKFTMSIIIHVNGVSGAGKTTLINNLKNNNKIVTIDIDDIDDENVLHMLTIQRYQNMLKTTEGMDKFINILSRMNERKIKSLIRKAKTANKVVVYISIGITNIDVDYTFNITCDTDTNYRRLMLRNLKLIHKHYSDIIALINNTTLTPYVINMLLIHKFKLRPQVPIQPLELDHIVRSHDNLSSDRKYTTLTQHQIYKQILDIINHIPEPKVKTKKRTTKSKK